MARRFRKREPTQKEQAPVEKAVVSDAGPISSLDQFAVDQANATRDSSILIDRAAGRIQPDEVQDAVDAAVDQDKLDTAAGEVVGGMDPAAGLPGLLGDPDALVESLLDRGFDSSTRFDNAATQAGLNLEDVLSETVGPTLEDVVTPFQDPRADGLPIPENDPAAGFGEGDDGGLGPHLPEDPNEGYGGGGGAGYQPLVDPQLAIVLSDSDRMKQAAANQLFPGESGDQKWVNEQAKKVADQTPLTDLEQAAMGKCSVCGGQGGHAPDCSRVGNKCMECGQVGGHANACSLKPDGSTKCDECGGTGGAHADTCSKKASSNDDKCDECGGTGGAHSTSCSKATANQDDDDSTPDPEGGGYQLVEPTAAELRAMAEAETNKITNPGGDSDFGPPSVTWAQARAKMQDAIDSQLDPYIQPTPDGGDDDENPLAEIIPSGLPEVDITPIDPGSGPDPIVNIISGGGAPPEIVTGGVGPDRGTLEDDAEEAGLP